MKLKSKFVIGIISIVLLLLMLVWVFLSPPISQNNVETTISPEYISGVYTYTLEMKNASIEIEVIVDEDNINSIRIVNLDDITAIYPLIESSFESVSAQIIDNQSLNNITYSEDNKYTCLTLIDAIDRTLDKAKK